MSYTIIKPADRQGWLAQREKGIGSSEVGTILGVNPWDTPYQLWRRKRGIDPPVEQNEAMRAGHILESAVATYFEQESGHKVIKSSEGDWLAVDNERPFLRVSPDRTYWLTGVRSKYSKGIVECKTTQVDIDPDDIPRYWFCQLMYQLGVMDYQQGAIAWLTRGCKFGYRDITFDPLFYAYMVERLQQFWQDCIVGGQEPPITNIDDVLIKFSTSDPSKMKEATPEIMEAISNIKSLKPQIDNLSQQKKEAENTIKAFMEDAESLCIPGSSSTNPSILCTYRTAKASQKFDEKRFAAEHPDLYTSYLTTTPGSRRFLIK